MEFIEVLPNTGGDSPDLDIVFVHGLNPLGDQRHAWKTWTCVEDGTFWPRDLLPSLIPTARILIFGYNSSVLSDANNAPVSTHASSLLRRVTNERENALHRPIIFVAHSLGGLLVKQALVDAGIPREDERQYACLKASTYGLVFFATPHLGGNKASIANVAAKVWSVFSRNPVNSLLGTLERNSLLNEISSDQFRHQVNDYRILSFYETKPMQVRVKRRKVFPRKASMMIVDRQSALLRAQREIQLGLDRNHSDICKFRRSGDYIYDDVSKNLKNMVDKARYYQVECGDAPRRELPPSYSHSRFFSNSVPGALPSHLALPRRAHRINLPKPCTPFIGRDKIIDDIRRSWLDMDSSQQRRLSLSGFGGVGKTELSRSLVDRLGPIRHVIWLGATDHELLRKDKRTAATGLIHELIRFDSTSSHSGTPQDQQGFYFSGTSPEHLMNTFEAWLRASHDADNRILLILDDIDGLKAEELQRLSNDLSGSSTDVIYTTRDPLMADPGMAWDAASFHIPPLEPQPAIDLFRHFTQRNRKLPTQVLGYPDGPDKVVVGNIIQCLSQVPSAIVVASHYMRDHIGLSPQAFETLLHNLGSHESQGQLINSHRSLVNYPYSITGSVRVSIIRLRRNANESPNLGLYEASFGLLQLLGSMGVARLFRPALSELSLALSEFYETHQKWEVEQRGFARLRDTAFVSSCIVELKRVSLLLETEENEGTIELNRLVGMAIKPLLHLSLLNPITVKELGEALTKSPNNRWYKLQDSNNL